jgi:hypothetical protein
MRGPIPVLPLAVTAAVWLAAFGGLSALKAVSPALALAATVAAVIVGVEALSPIGLRHGLARR